MSTIMFSDAAGTLADLHQKLGSERGSDVLESLKRLLRGENPFPVNIVPVPGQATWRKEGEYLIYLSLPPSQGLTGEQQIERLEQMGKRLSDAAKAVLRSKDFVPTPAGTIHNVVALRATFWEDPKRLTKNIQAEGKKRKWLEIHPEAVCIIRECFSDKELEAMGLLWIVGIHKPIGADGGPHLLYSYRHDEGDWLSTGWASPDSYWSGDGAFAFGLPQENQS